MCNTKKNNVFLIGMSGAGKSYWAKRLSQKLGRLFFDLDAGIEQETKMTIANIFTTKGEAFFRDAESKLLATISKNTNQIVAVGGGAPCFANNMQLMNNTGITIWIDPPLLVLVKQALTDTTHRPAIQQLSEYEVTAMFETRLKERAIFYKQAQYHLQGECINTTHLLAIIAQEIKL